MSIGRAYKMMSIYEAKESPSFGSFVSSHSSDIFLLGKYTACLIYDLRTPGRREGRSYHGYPK